MEKPTQGQHLVAEYWGCDPDVLSDAEAIARLLDEAVLATGATIVGRLFHRFTPQGISGVLLIEESHISIHTWPEHRYAAIDFYTCSGLDPRVAHPLLEARLAATRSEIMTIARGEPDAQMVCRRGPTPDRRRLANS